MSTKQRVLIVDDEPRNQRIVTEILEDLVDLNTASNGEEALNIADTFLPDLVLLDIMMPGIDGYKVCKELCTNPKLTTTKVILVSGKAMIEERLMGYEVGADDYMTKPFVPEELLAKVKVFLRLNEVEKQLNETNLNLESMVNERTRQLLDAESKLISSAKMSALGEMAGGIAHEINTPLGTLSLITEQMNQMLKDNELNKQTLIDLIKIVQDTVKRIHSIVIGLRTFSRDGSNDRFQIASVKSIIDSTLVLCQEKIENSGIHIQVSPIPDTLHIQCREVQISQVLMNLIGNACDAIASLPERWIKISAQTVGNELQISVTDSGPGIPENVYQKLFQPFFTTKEIGKGTGLGLSISKGILDAHRGSLIVDRGCKNTKFVVRIPFK